MNPERTVLRSRTQLGCLLALSLPTTALAAFFALLPLAALLARLLAPDTVEERFALGTFEVVVLLAFTLPLLLVLGRATRATLGKLRGKRSGPLVSWRTALVAALLLGLPALIAAAVALFRAEDARGLYYGAMGLSGAVLLLCGPLILYRLQRQKNDHTP